jgi:hypothetical protein
MANCLPALLLQRQNFVAISQGDTTGDPDCNFASEC